MLLLLLDTMWLLSLLVEVVVGLRRVLMRRVGRLVS